MLSAVQGGEVQCDPNSTDAANSPRGARGLHRESCPVLRVFYGIALSANVRIGVT